MRPTRFRTHLSTRCKRSRPLVAGVRLDTYPLPGCTAGALEGLRGQPASDATVNSEPEDIRTLRSPSIPRALATATSATGDLLALESDYLPHAWPHAMRPKRWPAWADPALERDRAGARPW